jgi:hypothetical protein
VRETFEFSRKAQACALLLGQRIDRKHGNGTNPYAVRFAFTTIPVDYRAKFASFLAASCVTGQTKHSGT